MTDAEKIARLTFRLNQSSALIKEMRGQAEAAGSLIERLQVERDQAVARAKRAESNLRHADDYIDWQYANERRAA